MIQSNDLNVYRKRGSKSRLHVQNGELVKFSSVLDDWKKIICGYMVHWSFSKKNCKMICFTNSALKSIQHSKDLMQFLLVQFLFCFKNIEIKLAQPRPHISKVIKNKKFHYHLTYHSSNTPFFFKGRGLTSPKIPGKGGWKDC